MATAATATTWTDAALPFPSAGRKHATLSGTGAPRLSSPSTPASGGARKVSGKRKRDSATTTPYVVVEHHPDVASPSPLVDERYRLAPSMSSPATHSTTTPDLRRYRTTWTSASPPHPSGPLGRETNGRPRLAPPPQTRSWSVGRVVSAVFALCYTFLPPLPSSAAHSGAAADDPAPPRLPGMYPADDDEPLPALRPAKRLHTGAGSGEWAFVDEPPAETTPASPASPRRRGRKSLAAAGSPSMSPGHRRRVSTACTRAAVLRPRRSATEWPLRTAETEPRDERAAGGSLSPEAWRLLARQERRERSVRKMSRQVQELIRQGQMALGSNYEVEIEEAGEDSGGEL